MVDTVYVRPDNDFGGAGHPICFIDFVNYLYTDDVHLDGTLLPPRDEQLVKARLEMLRNMAHRYSVLRLAAICTYQLEAIIGPCSTAEPSAAPTPVPSSRLVEDISTALFHETALATDGLSNSPRLSDVRFVKLDRMIHTSNRHVGKHAGKGKLKLPPEGYRGQHQLMSAHKAILACQSEYFKMMFESGMSESAAASSISLDNDESFNSLFVLLEYLYTQDTPHLTPQTAVEVFVASIHRYDLPDLARRCEICIKRHLDSESATSIAEVARRLNQPLLADYCLQFIKMSKIHGLLGQMQTNKQQQPQSQNCEIM